MTAWSIAFAPLVPLWLLYALAAVALLISIALFWRRTRGAGLRTLAFGLALLGLCDPSLAAGEPASAERHRGGRRRPFGEPADRRPARQTDKARDEVEARLKALGDVDMRVVETSRDGIRRRGHPPVRRAARRARRRAAGAGRRRHHDHRRRRARHSRLRRRARLRRSAARAHHRARRRAAAADRTGRGAALRHRRQGPGDRRPHPRQRRSGRAGQAHRSAGRRDDRDDRRPGRERSKSGRRSSMPAST